MEGDGYLKQSETQSKNFFRLLFSVAVPTIIILYIIELSIMFFLHRVAHLSPLAETWVDSTLLIALMSPVLYFLAFRPLNAELEARQRGEDLLKDMNKMLEQKVLERTEALEASETRLYSALDNAQDAVISADGNGNIIYWNRMAETLFGYHTSETVGKTLTMIMPERFREAHQKGLQRYISTEQPKVIGRVVELVGLHRNGSEFPLELSLSAWKVGSSHFFTAIVRDISVRKRAEEETKKAYDALKSMQRELIQAEKLAAVGKLASGIAHEVKNPLGVVLQGLEYLDGSIKSKDQEMAEILGAMKEAVQRADKIVRELLNFSRPSDVSLKLIPIRRVVDMAVMLVKKHLSLEKVSISLDISSDLPAALVDEDKMIQVLINLFQNSAHAMPSGGNLTVRCYSKLLDKPGNGVGSRATDVFRVGETAVICEVHDTGKGIPKDKIDKVYDPFFTTKAPGEGTGLGLSIVKTIIDSHRGLITIASEVDRGTTVTISLHSTI